MIDKSDNQLDEPEKPLAQPGKPPKARGAGFALFVASLALFFTAAGIAAGYKHWQRMSDRAKGNARKIEAIEAALPAKVDSPAFEQLNTELSERIKAHQTVAEKQLRDMAEMQTQTRQFAETVGTQVEKITTLQASLQHQTDQQAGGEAWQLAEVAFLLRLAVRELALARNQESAREALIAADQLLSEIGAVDYLPVRQQIARDLTALEAVAVVDIAALSAQIDALLHGLQPDVIVVSEVQPDQADSSGKQEDLPSAAPVTDAKHAESIEQSPRTENDASLWSGYKQQALDTLSQIVFVRQIDKPLVTTLNAEARQHLFQLLQLRLENLRLLALQGNNRAYHAQIALLRTTLHEYYAADQVTEWLAVLDTLDAIDLQPAYPDISGSLRQLEQARQMNMAQGQQ